jgi:hypothetical protein
MVRSRHVTDASDHATEMLLRGHKRTLGDAELRATVDRAWRRIAQEPAPRHLLPGFAARRGLHRLLLPSAALLCFLLGLGIGLSLDPDANIYESALSDLASHPIVAEIAP